MSRNPSSHRLVLHACLTLLACTLVPATAAQAQAGEAPKKEEAAAKVEPGPELKNSVGMKFRLVRAGEFEMGSTNEFGRYAHEHRHQVKLTKAFHMGACEVTQEQYAKVMGGNPSFFAASGKHAEKVKGMETAKFPVEGVSWHDAIEFCKKLSARPEEQAAGRTYRLPTEAEWEYACRAGTTTVFHYGESLSSKQANFDGNHPYLERQDVIKGESPEKLKGPYLGRPAAVASYEPNAFGLYDMHGNVWEWVADWYSPVYYKSSPDTDPAGPEEGTEKVARGGGWYYFAAGCRSASRYYRKPEEKNDLYGFRVVCVQGKPSGRVRRF